MVAPAARIIRWECRGCAENFAQAGDKPRRNRRARTNGLDPRIRPGACGSGSSPSFGWSRREFCAVDGRRAHRTSLGRRKRSQNGVRAAAGCGSGWHGRGPQICHASRSLCSGRGRLHHRFRLQSHHAKGSPGRAHQGGPGRVPSDSSDRAGRCRWSWKQARAQPWCCQVTMAYGGGGEVQCWRALELQGQDLTIGTDPPVIVGTTPPS